MEYKLSDNTWDNKELEAIQRVIQSGFYSMGKEVAEYEKLFAEKVGSKYAIMTNSGSSANLLAVAALCYSDRLKEGDEVIVPAVSWSTTYFPLAQYNLKLKFVDIDVETLNIDVNKLKKSITKDTKAIMCVNLLGNPNNFEVYVEKIRLFLLKITVSLWVQNTRVNNLVPLDYWEHIQPFIHITFVLWRVEL